MRHADATQFERGTISWLQPTNVSLPIMRWLDDGVNSRARPCPHEPRPTLKGCSRRIQFYRVYSPNSPRSEDELPVPVVGCEASFIGGRESSPLGINQATGSSKMSVLARKFHQLHDLQQARQDF